jgi:serine protease Do
MHPVLRLSIVMSVALAALVAACTKPTTTAQTPSANWGPVVGGADTVSSDRRLALYTKPAVVQIFDGCEGKAVWRPTGKTYEVGIEASGSGFFANPDGYIVTNAHVVETTKDGPNACVDKLFQRFVEQFAKEMGADPKAMLQDPRVRQQVQFREVKQIHEVLTPGGSLHPFEIKAYGAPTGEGKDTAVIKIEIKNAPVLTIADSDTIAILDRVVVVGYPGVADLSADPRNKREASFTDGRLSARKLMDDGSPILQISAPVTHGNSGGPVLNERGEVIGLATFHLVAENGQQVPGFTFVVPSNTVMEFVRQAGTTNHKGLVDRPYYEGLSLYWRGSYRQAIEKLEEVKRLFPQHSEADRLIRESETAIADAKSRRGPFLERVGK